MTTHQRPDPHETWLLVANTIAARGTCKRRRVGCVLTDIDGYVLSTGFNGVGPDQPHCIDTPCAGASFPTGQGLGECEAIHAEQNALITCADVRKVAFIYSTVAPCKHCTKMLLRTQARSIYFIDDYEQSGRELWERAGRNWIKHSTAMLGVSRYFSIPHEYPVDPIQASIIATSLSRIG